MKSNTSPFIVFAATCCFVACIGDFVITCLLGFFYKGYDFLSQSESYLGSSNSPVAMYMNAWGVLFSLLFVVFAYALYKTIFRKGAWQLTAVLLILIYGLGEGIGSGLFPYDHIGKALTLTGKLHSIFSSIGDMALVALPFVALKIFTGKLHPRLNLFAWVVAVSGLALILMFALANKNIVPMKGLWQRLYLLDYYLLLIVLAIYMVAHSANNASS